MWLSIIVPVYNVEQYIRPCLESILRQKLDAADYEIIIVNDGTRDGSMEMINDIIQQHGNIIVINQENQGLSMARNAGLKHAGGKYILFVDSDDLLLNDTLKPILDCTKDSSVDMVMGGFLKLTDQQINNDVPVLGFVKEPVEMSGEEAFIRFFNPRECYVWRTLFRKDFLIANHIRFLPGIYFEDIPFTTECYLKANRCVSLSIPFYIYRQRPNSIVSSVNKNKIKDYNIVIEYLWNLKNRLDLTDNKLEKLSDTIFMTFSLEMWYLTTERGLYCYRNEIIKDLKNRVPNLSFQNGIKQIIVSCLFKYIPYSYLWLRSVFRTKTFK